jgi:hypothetical protein
MSFDDGIAAGTKLIQAALQSPNYAQGASGWTVNRAGDAEFNSVVIRGGLFVGGTITGTTVIGSDFQSTNYVPGVSGFDLNANTSTIDFTTNPISGGAFTGASFQSADYVAFTSGFLLSGPTGGPDHVEFNTAVAVNNGSITVGTGAGQVILNGTVGGGGSVTFHNGLAGLSASLLGGSLLTLKTGTVIGTGNTVPAEIDMAPGLTGGLGTVTLPATTGLAAPAMRAVGTFDATTYNPATTFGVQTTAAETITCPPSGTIWVSVKTVAVVAAAATLTVNSFCLLSVLVRNTTQGTSPFNPTAAAQRYAQVNGTWQTAGNAGAITLNYVLAIAGCGNAGDSLTVTPVFAQQTAGQYNVFRTEVSVMASP